MSRNKIQDFSGFPDGISLSGYGKCNRLNVFSCQGKKCSFKRTSKEDLVQSSVHISGFRDLTA
jgi:hypothetical protein